VRSVVHRKGTNVHNHLQPPDHNASENHACARRVLVHASDKRDTDLIVVNRGNSHWLPTKCIREKPVAPLFPEPDAHHACAVIDLT
jgi:hypothetical protein